MDEITRANEKELQKTNNIITNISNKVEIIFGIAKCAEDVYKNGKVTKREGLEIDKRKAECLDPKTAEYNKFLGIREGDGWTVR